MKHLRIFITEDENVQALLLRKTLSELGHTVCGMAQSGEETLELIENLKPDLIMMDIHLAGEMDGINTAKLVREKIDVPIIFVTAADDQKTIEEAVASNAHGYIFKPAKNLRDISTVIDMAITKHGFELRLKNLNKELDDKVKQRTKELESANLQLKKALNKERELNEFKSIIISNVSHHFKTPLTTISSSAELIGKNVEMKGDPKRILKHTARIQDSVEMLNQLITEMLYVENADATKHLKAIEEMNLETYLKKFVDEMKHGICRNHVFKTKIDLEKPIVNLDKNLLNQILSNLVLNAATYSNEGTEIFMSVTTTDNKLYGIVKDQGIGIPKKDQKKLFERFYRGSNVGYRQGTGLGLSIISKSLEMLDGEIELHSEENVGTEFRFSFPLPQALLD